MVCTNNHGHGTVKIIVELFGLAKMATGRSEIVIRLPKLSSAKEAITAIGFHCKELNGIAIADDGSGLMESYTMNLNGDMFLDDKAVIFKPGDRILLFSSQAGG